MRPAKDKLDDLLDELMSTDPNYEKEIIALQEKYKCSISCDIEKHNVLQHTFYYEVDFGIDENLFIEIESGINNGTQLNNDSWEVNTKPENRTAKVLKDIVLDDDFYTKGSFLRKKAQAILDANKNKLFDFHRKNNYDNYVTGGNSKMKLDSLLSQLKLTYIYEEIQVDCNFV